MKVFNDIKKELKKDINCVYTRKRGNKNARSASQDFYTDLAFERIKKKYEEKIDN